MGTMVQMDARGGTKTRGPDGKFPRRPGSSVTLRHWRVFHAVHDCGSFSEAAALLHLTQPAVCYTIGVLQEHVGIPLYRIERRRVVVTEDGKKLLSLSRHLLKSAISLEGYAKKLSTCLEDRVQVFIDNMFPRKEISPVLDAFMLAHPEANTLLDEIEHHDIAARLGESPTALAIGSKVPEDCAGKSLANIEYVPVFHSAQPFALRNDMMPEDVNRFVRIEVRGQHRIMPARHGTLRETPVRTITVPNVDDALELLLSCDAYAWLPTSMAERSGVRERLRILRPVEDERRFLEFFLIRRASENSRRLLHLADEIRKVFS